MLEGGWSRAWKTVKGQEVQRVAEAQNGELGGARSQTESEKEEAELKLQRKG